MRVVVDTNVIASAIFFGGKPKQIIDLIMENEIDSFITVDIAKEYQATVDYLRSKYPVKAPKIPLNEIIEHCNLIETNSSVDICRDPDDNKFIECAVDGKCIFIVSGDKDLLTIGQYGDIEIVTAADFLERYI